MTWGDIPRGPWSVHADQRVPWDDLHPHIADLLRERQGPPPPAPKSDDVPGLLLLPGEGGWFGLGEPDPGGHIEMRILATGRDRARVIAMGTDRGYAVFEEVS